MKAQKRFWRIVLTVSFDRWRASDIFEGSEVSRVMPAASMAMSLPVAMAMPRSASARAAPSLMPSPTMATLCPSLLRRWMYSTLSSGLTFPI